MTSWSRFLAGLRTGSIPLRNATSAPSHKVNVYQGSRWEHEAQQSLRCQAACKAVICASSDGKNTAGPSISRAGSAIAAVHAEAALTADEYPALHGAAPATPRGIWAARLAAAAAAATPAIPGPLTTHATMAADATSTIAEPCSPAGPCTPSAADAICSPFAVDMAPCPAIEPAAPWQIPARRTDASDNIQAGCCYNPATVTLYARTPAAETCQQLPEPTTTTPLATAPAKAIAPYKPPHRRTWAEQKAAAEAGKPGKPCAWPQLTAGPQLHTVVWTAALIPLYRIALVGWSSG